MLWGCLDCILAVMLCIHFFFRCCQGPAEGESQEIPQPVNVWRAFKIKVIAGSWQQFCFCGRRRNEEECNKFRLKLELQINSRAYCYGPLRFI